MNANTVPEASGCPITGSAHGPRLAGNPHSPPAPFTMREGGASSAEVEFVDGHRGLLVTGYDAARAVLEDSGFSQSPRHFLYGPPEGDVPDADDRAMASLAVGGILGLDGPQHHRLRRAVTPHFSIKAVRQHRDAIDRIVDDSLTAMLAGPNPVNLAAALAEPVSIATHCHVLGVPDVHLAAFIEAFVETSSGQHQFEVTRQILETLAQTGQPGVLSDLLASDLTPSEVEGLAFSLLISGRDNVAYMITMAVVTFLSHRNQWDRLRSEPHLLPSALEEVFRYDAVFLSLFPRTALDDRDIHGLSIGAGTTVAVSTVAANRDSTRFPDPSRFDIDRDAAGHLTFGHGHHACIGQQLARAQVGAVVTQLINRVPRLALESFAFENPYPMASHLPTYSVPPAMVSW